jgi:hypothetical protein
MAEIPDVGFDIEELLRKFIPVGLDELLWSRPIGIVTFILKTRPQRNHMIG